MSGALEEIAAPRLAQPALDSDTTCATSETVTSIHLMAERLTTVYDVWTEYAFGLNGGPSIRDLVKEHGNKWRNMSSSKEKKKFERRMRICKVFTYCITSYIADYRKNDAQWRN